MIHVVERFIVKHSVMYLEWLMSMYTLVNMCTYIIIICTYTNVYMSGKEQVIKI